MRNGRIKTCQIKDSDRFQYTVLQNTYEHTTEHTRIKLAFVRRAVNVRVFTGYLLGTGSGNLGARWYSAPQPPFTG